MMSTLNAREKQLIERLMSLRDRYSQGKIDGTTYTRRVLDVKILLAQERVAKLFRESA
jgi:hypothetical protein